MIMEQAKYYWNENKKYQHVDNPDQEEKAPAVKKPVLLPRLKKSRSWQWIKSKDSDSTIQAQKKLLKLYTY